MAEIGLDGASVVAVVASLKPVSVAQHVERTRKVPTGASWRLLGYAVGELDSAPMFTPCFTSGPCGRGNMRNSQGWHGLAEVAVAVNADISNTSE